MKKIIFIVVLLLHIFCLSDGYAQVYLEQGKIVHDINPGQNITGEVVVHNTTDEAVDLNIYWEDFAYEAPYDGQKQFFAQGTREDSMGPWVSFFPKELRLEPFGHKAVSYTINTPDQIQGGYYGVLFFENTTSKVEETTGLNIVTRVGCLFFAETVGKTKKLTVENLSFEGQNLEMTVKNTGDVTLIPDGTYYIIDAEGLIVDRGKLTKLYLPSLSETEIKLVFNKEFEAGLYNMVMTFDLQNNDVKVKEVDFTVDSSLNATITRTRD